MNSEQIKHLISVGAALEKQVKAAAKLIEDLFRAPVKAYLVELPAAERREGLEISGVKAYIQEDRPKDVVDEETLEKDFLKAVSEGKIQGAQLKGLIKDGSIGIKNPEAMAQFMSLLLSNGGYTERIPGGARPALKFLTTNEGQFTGLQTKLRETVDLEGLIRAAAQAEAQRSGRAAIR